MRYRALGTSDIQISEIGFGTWGIGGLTSYSYGPTDDTESKAALRLAYKEGINFFDTAPAYGDGHSERLLGDVFQNKRDKILIATKGGCVSFEQPLDFSVESLRTELEASLKRLQTDYIDLYQLHNPSPGFDGYEEVLGLLSDWRDAGVVRSIGISLSHPDDGYWAIEHIKPDSIQVNLNLLDQRCIDNGLLETTEQHGISLIARTPLCLGFLTGHISESTVFSKHDHRNRWSPEQIKRWIDAGQEVAGASAYGNKRSLLHLALAFCVSFPNVVSTIPGMMTREEVMENIAIEKWPLLEKADLAAIREAYGETDIYSDKQPKVMLCRQQ